MIHNKLLRLSEIINSDQPIKQYADEVYELRTTLDEHFTEEEKISFANKIKTRVQLEARMTLQANNCWGAVLMATGSGKSKIAIDIIDGELGARLTAKILIVVPTEKLRDNNWPDEITKWGYAKHLDHIERCCYASLNKYEMEHFSLVILDEGHNITENNARFFKQNTISRCILLTATRPKEPAKIAILQNLNILPVYTLSLDESVKLGLVAPYDITIITMSLDRIDKYIKGGTKLKPFMTTEKAHYDYLSRILAAHPSKRGFLNRMRFIYNLKSKTEAAKLILEHVIPKELRTLIFCGSKIQANELCEYRFYSRPTPPKKLKGDPPDKEKEKYAAELAVYNNMMKYYQGDEFYFKFKNEEINKLSCVNALNEGDNINNLDVGLMVQINSNERDFIQRTGRFIRYRFGHIGRIIILCVDDTIEKDWVKAATKNLNSINIKTIELSRLRMGLETISFD